MVDVYKSESEARRKISEEQAKREFPKVENRGLNCPNCHVWIPYAGDKTVCKSCGWKAKS